MNINTEVVALNVSNILVKKEQENKNIKSTLKINEDIKYENKTKDLGIGNENLVASESSINNIDMAEELLKNTKENILENSAMAILSQSNKQPEQIIGLL